MPKVALIGDLCLDVFMKIHDYPAPGGDGLAEQLVEQSGGSAANTAIALAHLGVIPCLLTHTGRDHWATQVLATLSTEGVDTNRILQEKGDTTGITFLAVTPEGERTMFTYRGANAHLDPREISPEILADCAMLHLSGYACLKAPQSLAVMKAVEIAQHHGIGISLDIGVEPAHVMGETLPKLLPKLALLILGVPEACAIAATQNISDAVQFLIDQGVQTVGLKLGREGCQLTTRSFQVELPGYRVDVVDTTGAGDAFSAGMVCGLVHGWDLEATGTLANAMGALATTRWGAGAALPKKDEIIQFLISAQPPKGPPGTAIQRTIRQLTR